MKTYEELRKEVESIKAALEGATSVAEIEAISTRIESEKEGLKVNNLEMSYAISGEVSREEYLAAAKYGPQLILLALQDLSWSAHIKRTRILFPNLKISDIK